MARGPSEKTPAPSLARDWSGGGSGACDSNSCYFPSCRKTTNCECEMCLASINATLDLIPSQPSLSRLAGRKMIRKTGSPRPHSPATPSLTTVTESTISAAENIASPALKSTAKTRPPRKIRIIEKNSSSPPSLARILLVILLALLLDLGAPAVLRRSFGPGLGAQTVMKIGEKSNLVSGNLKGRLQYVEKEIGKLVDGQVANCSAPNSGWEFNQGGQILFNWRCLIYSSMAEEVSIWGSPLPSSGLLPTGITPRLRTLLSGRLMEWAGGASRSKWRTSNCSSCSWTSEKWSVPVVRLDQETWVLEYQQKPWMHGTGMLQALYEMVRVGASLRFKELKHMPWRTLTLSSQIFQIRYDTYMELVPT